jgi:hypothetical protein
MVDLDSIRWPQSIRGVNDLPKEVKRAIYLSLIPPEVLTEFGIDPNDNEQVIINCPHDTRSVEIAAYLRGDCPDPLLYLHMADTMNNQIVILLLVVNDPVSPRFDVDVDEDGLSTQFGTLRRNIPEETSAMQAGLAPGQVRRGLRMIQRAVSTFERFVDRLGHDLVMVEPMFYHNAIMFEGHGFDYIVGRRRMEWIDREIRPGGCIHVRLDGSTPFRPPDAWKTVCGRSWAIHDGVLGEPLGDLRMYKRVGHHAGACTFPEAEW